MSGQPRDLVLEHGGVPSPVTGPREGDDHHAVLGAAHPGRVRLQIRRHRSQIQRPPPPSPLTTVLPRAPPGADPAPASSPFAGTYRRHHCPRHLIEDHRFDHRALDTDQSLP